MTEEFLHHIWKFRLFHQTDLKTETGEMLEIIKVGDHNSDSGPDFFNAKLKIGTTEWAGNVEIHINSSDWEKHHHQNDMAYNNIILHVVHNADKILYRKNGEEIPTLELKNIFQKSVFEKYEQFKYSNDWIPCEKLVSSVPDFVKNAWLERLLIERLEIKSKDILDRLKLNNNNWEETFYQHLARNFGFKINAVPFELLSKSLPNATLAKHKNSLFQLEAMLFGQSGLLEQQFKDKYLQGLQNEYQFLKKKFSFTSIDSHLWKFLRLRPANFPTIRISQFAALVHQSEHLFSKILEIRDLKEIQKLLNVSVSDYWQTHYMLDKISPKRSKNFGKTATDIIIINTIVPFLFIYGKHKKQEKFVERAIEFLEKTQGENNTIVNRFAALKFNVGSAYNTQSLLQLKNNYCTPKRCLQCGVGNSLLKK